MSRRSLFGLVLVGTGAIAAARVPAAAAGGLAASDIDILNYALVLEYLQASFYTEAERSGALSGRTAEAARIVGATERAHVKAFRKLLGSRRCVPCHWGTFPLLTGTPDELRRLAPNAQIESVEPGGSIAL